MTPTKEVAPATTGGVPALYTPPPLEIDRDDVQIPAIKFAHPSSPLCEEHGLRLGTIYAALSKDDPEPVTLWDPNAKGENPGVRVHVLGMYKGKSAKVGEDFKTWSFSDPDAPADADTTYNYQLALPEVDPEMWFRMTLARSKAAAARTMNTVMARNAARGPAYLFAFLLTTTNKKKDGVGQWTVPQARHVEADPEHVEIAQNLAMMVGSRPQPTPAATSTDEPSI